MRCLLLPTAARGLEGHLRVPPSKSLAQRGLLAACLAGPPAGLAPFSPAEDAQLLLEAMRKLGFYIQPEGDGLRVEGFSPAPEAELFLGNNGTGARLLLAQLATSPGRFLLDGVPRLRQRPIAPLVRALRQLGAAIEGERLPLRVEGRGLTGGQVEVDASQSSQFVSALLFLGVRLPQGLVVEVQGQLPSRPYVEMSLEVLKAFGAEVGGNGTRFWARGPLKPQLFAVEGDWSAAAFPLVGAAVAGGEVEVEGVSLKSRQADAVVAELLRRVGCQIWATATGVRVRGPACLPLEADLRHCPDLFPALAVLVALRGGKLTGLGHLAGKESNRVRVMASHLRSLGLPVEAGEDWFQASAGGVPRAPGEPCSPEGDHRIAMALAVAGLVTPGLRLVQPECVAKSWPEFFSWWQGLLRP